MNFPPYVHAVLPDVSEDKWMCQAQGINECGVTTPANALNVLSRGQRFYDKNQLMHEAGPLFQRKLGGSPSFITATLLKKHGAGTHFGNLSRTDGDAILRDLIDRGVPVCIEFGQNKIGPIPVYGVHSVLLVGYSEPFTDATGNHHEQYYVIDAQYTVNGAFSLDTNNIDLDGDGVVESYPGNRSYERVEFWSKYPTGIYFPAFPSQDLHDAWYRQHIRPQFSLPVLGWFRNTLLTGSYDRWIG